MIEFEIAMIHDVYTYDLYMKWYRGISKWISEHIYD